MLVDAVVTELRSAPSTTCVTETAARTRRGTPFTVHATTYVLASGGIENPRLLLASRGTTPQGLGNAFDQVGRYFQEHPHYHSGLVVPVDRHLHDRPEAWDVHLDDGHPVQRKYGLTQAAQRQHGLLNTAFFITPRPASWLVPYTSAGTHDASRLQAVRHVKRMLSTRRPSPGATRDLVLAMGAAPRMAAYTFRQSRAQQAHRAGRRSRFPLVFTLGAMAEQQPRDDSRVCLSAEPDRFGVPHAQLDWRLGDDDADSMRRSHDLVSPALERALGARAVPLLPSDELPALGWGYHHMGTTRMSTRPDEGVVDADLRVHGVSNVFVAGSSVFPSSGSANPTLTIVALSMRLADRLRHELRIPTSP